MNIWLVITYEHVEAETATEAARLAKTGLSSPWSQRITRAGEPVAVVRVQ